jgi:hypothetical protein
MLISKVENRKKTKDRSRPSLILLGLKIEENIEGEIEDHAIAKMNKEKINWRV